MAKPDYKIGDRFVGEVALFDERDERVFVQEETGLEFTFPPHYRFAKVCRHIEDHHLDESAKKGFFTAEDDRLVFGRVEYEVIDILRGNRRSIIYYSNKCFNPDGELMFNKKKYAVKGTLTAKINRYRMKKESTDARA